MTHPDHQQQSQESFTTNRLIEKAATNQQRIIDSLTNAIFEIVDPESKINRTVIIKSIANHLINNPQLIILLNTYTRTNQITGMVTQELKKMSDSNSMAYDKDTTAFCSQHFYELIHEAPQFIQAVLTEIENRKSVR